MTALTPGSPADDNDTVRMNAAGEEAQVAAAPGGSATDWTTQSGTNGLSQLKSTTTGLRPAGAPVLGPRPVYRPDVDQATTQAFGRPTGVQGSFAPGRAITPPPGAQIRPPDPVLAEAFARPPGESASLQRDPDRHEPEPIAGPADPWRDPDAVARLGAPAVATPAAAHLPPAPKLTAREVLFGSRVAPRALAALAAVALAIALVGGLVGRLTAEAGENLTSSKVTLAQGGNADRPQGQVEKVADAVLPSVATIQATSGDDLSIGSGVVIDGGGYVVTNNHVISMAARPGSKAKIFVIFSDGSKVPGSIVGRDTKTDLAVLKVSANNLKVAQLGRSGDVRVGQDVLAVGSPLGLSKTVTTGIVSALHRPVRLAGEESDTNAVIDGVQTDASINPGNSGGPLIDFNGRVIGINTAIKSGSGGSVGLGFAIPVDVVKKVADSLIRTGKMNHPDLGVRASTKVSDTRSGASVEDVRKDSPAARAGIVERDIIVRLADRDVTSADELVVAYQSQQINERVPVKLIRDGREVEVQVTLGSD